MVVALGIALAIRIDMVRAIPGSVLIPAESRGEALNSSVEWGDEPHVQCPGPRGEDVLAAVPDNDERRLLCGFDDHALSSLSDGVHPQYLRGVEAGGQLRRCDEERRSDAGEPVGRMLIQSLRGCNLEIETLRDAVDYVLVEHWPAKALPELHGEVTAASAKLAADCYEIDRFVLHVLFVPLASEVLRRVRLTRMQAGLRSICTEQT